MTTCSIYLSAPVSAVREVVESIARERGAVVDIESANEYPGYRTAVDLFNYPNGERLAESIANELRKRLPGVDVDTEHTIDSRLSADSA